MNLSRFRVCEGRSSAKDRLICPSGGRVPDNKVHCSYIFLTYTRCSIEDIGDFKIAVKNLISRLGTEASLKSAQIGYFGCLERHKDNSPHYHLLLSFSKQINWSLKSARARFLLPENFTRSVNMVVPGHHQSTYIFVQNHVRYMRKQARQGDFVGKPFSAMLESKQDRRREFKRILDAPSKADKMELMQDLQPETFIKSFINMRACFDYFHPMENEYPLYQIPTHVNESLFVKPEAIFQWECDNLIHPIPGRKKCLILIGGSRLGKTEFTNWLASQYGLFSIFNVGWDVKCFRKGHQLCVLHDMRPFGDYRSILGCQERFHAHGRYGKELMFEWGAVPSIWTFNEDNSILRWPETDAAYVKQNADIVYINEPLFRGN